MLDQTAKEQIRSRLPIEQVIGRYVSLQKSGSSFKARCPFHQEKTPSFHVNSLNGFYHCFGCGAGGDIFSFVQNIEGVSFVEALQLLADEAGVELPRHTGAHSGSADTGSGQVSAAAPPAKPRLHQLMDFAQRWFYGNVKNAPQVIDYLKSRRLSPQTVKQYQIGWAPQSWDAFTLAAQKAGFSTDELIATGMSSAKDKRVFDRFRNRIIFPLIGSNMKTIGFAARTIDNEQGPKYLNSPETVLYNKSKFLYGLYRSRQYISQSEEAIVVEGFMDFISLYEIGIKNLVATSGTALTEYHGTTLSRFASKIILLFDGDAAGKAAAERAVFTLASQLVSCYVVLLPDGEDPDSFARTNNAAFIRSFIQEQAVEGFLFLLNLALKRFGLDSSQAKASIVQFVKPYLDAQRDEVSRESARQLLSEKIGVSKNILHKSLRNNYHKDTIQQDVPSKLASTLEGSFIGLLMHNPHLIEKAKEVIAAPMIQHPEARRVYELMSSCGEPQTIIRKVVESENNAAVKRQLSYIAFHPVQHDQIEQELEHYMYRLQIKFLKSKKREYTQAIKQNPKEYQKLFELQQTVSKHLRDLENNHA